MVIGIAEKSLAANVVTDKRSYFVPLTLMVSLYFGIGFITALNDILVPHFKDLFHLTNVTALLVQFCFFGAYFVMSVPSGWIVGKIGYKSGIVVSLSLMGTGLLLFLPASLIIFYPLFLFALFVVGSGLALLQVAINPYVGALVTSRNSFVASQSRWRFQFNCDYDRAKSGSGIHLHRCWGISSTTGTLCACPLRHPRDLRLWNGCHHQIRPSSRSHRGEGCEVSFGGQCLAVPSSSPGGLRDLLLRGR